MNMAGNYVADNQLVPVIYECPHALRLFIAFFYVFMKLSAWVAGVSCLVCADVCCAAWSP